MSEKRKKVNNEFVYKRKRDQNMFTRLLLLFSYPRAVLCTGSKRAPRGWCAGEMKTNHRCFSEGGRDATPLLIISTARCRRSWACVVVRVPTWFPRIFRFLGNRVACEKERKEDAHEKKEISGVSHCARRRRRRISAARSLSARFPTTPSLCLSVCLAVSVFSQRERKRDR